MCMSSLERTVRWVFLIGAFTSTAALFVAAMVAPLVS
jgi:hypothetical protein